MPRRWYLFPALLAFATLLLAAWTVEVAHLRAEASMIRLEAPGRRDVKVSRTGEWYLFNEIVTRKNGQILRSGRQEGLLAAVKTIEGKAVSLSPPRRPIRYDFNDTRGIAFARFDVTQPSFLHIEAFYRQGKEPEPGTLVLIAGEDLKYLSAPAWPWLLAVILTLGCIGMTAGICHSRIRKLVDYESRAVPTISSTARPAPIWRRAIATMLDLALLVMLLMGISPILSPAIEMMLNSPSVWVRTILGLMLSVLLLCYYIVPEALFGGTPGKLVTSLRTVTAEGRKLRFERSIVRNLVRLIDLFPFCYLVGAVTHLLSKNNRRLGDIAADSLVVVR